MMVQVVEPLLQHLRAIGVLDGHPEEVDEPGQGVLVHRVDVGQVGDREKQDSTVNGDWLVAQPRPVNLLLRLLRDSLSEREKQCKTVVDQAS